MPELFDVSPALQRAIRIGEDGILLGRARQLAEGLELDDSCFPLSQAVQDETEELAHLGHVFGHAGQGSQRAPCVVVALRGEGALGFFDAAQSRGRLTRANCFGDCFAQIHGAGRTAG